ncbi:MerR family transcriptional regulator [Actinoplanes rectilineatus]|uniref:MerR family transcriptional regulator n=1 Tax=Actinoplanes rectilineatus TaxID=113571 RepID=UPI0005F2F449|nr:MerR family transcriptional regulator [Actinoplanes rectilineatus]
MRIGDLAVQTGVSVRALRYYEEQGLLVPQRSSGGHRHYPESAVGHVRIIQQFYAAGVPSRTIAAMLTDAETGTATPEVIALLTAERERIEQRYAEIVAARDRLDVIIAGASATLRSGRSCRVADGFEKEQN